MWEWSFNAEVLGAQEFRSSTIIVFRSGVAENLEFVLFSKVQGVSLFPEV